MIWDVDRVQAIVKRAGIGIPAFRQNRQESCANHALRLVEAHFNLNPKCNCGSWKCLGSYATLGERITRAENFFNGRESIQQMDMIQVVR